jgi:hypothetical protein
MNHVEVVPRAVLEPQQQQQPRLANVLTLACVSGPACVSGCGCAAACGCVAGGVCAAASVCAAAGVVGVVVGIGDGGGRSGRGGVADGPAWSVAILDHGCIAVVVGSTWSENRRIRNSITAGASRCPLNVGSQQDGYF